MNAYHVFYKSKDMGEYHEIDLLVNLASCLFWKKLYGSIKLYCNQEFLDYIKSYGLDKAYDEINVDVLENTPFKSYLPKYWSFCKIHAIKHISKTEDRFVIIDNDFYPSLSHDIDWECDFIGYHKEAFDKFQETNAYEAPEQFLNETNYSKLNWDVNPINCAFMYFNNKTLIDTWYSWSIGIIATNAEKPHLPYNRDTIFIEQYLIASLVNTLNLNWKVLLPNTYLQYIDFNKNGYEWYPLVDSKSEYREVFNKFRHIWGLKRFYDQKEWRDFILGIVIDDLELNFNLDNLKQEYTLLLDTCANILALEE
jgi:hypothetical protein